MSARVVAALLVLAGLTGCTTWVKPGATPAQRDAALSRCEANAYRQAPAAPITVMTDAGGWKEGDKVCRTVDGQRVCTRQPPRFQGPRYSTQDANEDARDAFVADCMFSQGWTRQ